MSDEAINKPADLVDPAVLAAECRTFAEGLERQADAAGGRNAGTGHPFPEQFLRAAARVLAAAGTFAARHAPPAPTPDSNATAEPAAQPAAPSEPPKPPEPAPAVAGRKK